MACLKCYEYYISTFTDNTESGSITTLSIVKAVSNEFAFDKLIGSFNSSWLIAILHCYHRQMPEKMQY